MNHLKTQLLLLACLVSTTHLIDATTTNIVPRSQSFNAARQMVGWNNPEWGINRYPEDKYYSSMNLTFEYTRSFRADNLARCLFGDDLTCGPCDDLAIRISGSGIADRSSSDWLAEYFGLPRNFQSTVSFKPTISNFILDFSFYAGLDAWVDGMYFRIHGPFVHTTWNLNAQETICAQGSDDLGSYFQGYFSSNIVPVATMNQSFLNYSNGCVPKINNDFTSDNEYDCLNNRNPNARCTPLGDITWQSLCTSKIKNGCDCDGLSRNGFAELRMVLGYNFLDDAQEEYHAGIGIYAAAPTGTSVGEQDKCDSNGRYLFEPIVGNGKHWELGAQVTAHHIWWRSKDDSKSLGLYVEANVTHLFGARQIRSFDLYSAGNNSRYMLAERLDSDLNSIPRFDNNGVTLEFANEYAPVANITQRSVKTSIAVQGDIAVSLAYQANNFQWDLGYNFWGRTCENICIDECCPTDLGIWALKGDQRVYGFTDPSGPDPVGIAIKLPVTDSHADIHAGSNMQNGVNYAQDNPTGPINAYADNPFGPDRPGITILPTGGNTMFISNPIVAIKENDFDLTGTRGTSNKIFTNFNWKWDYREDSQWTPYFGIGGEVEFGSTDNGCCNINQCENSCKTNCGTNCGSIVTSEYTNPCNIQPACTGLPRREESPTKCVDCAISQWGIWLKLGASYN